MSKVEKIIKVYEDGTQEEIQHGIAMSVDGDDFNIQFVDIKAQDMVRSSIGLVEALKKLGLGQALEEMVALYYADQPKVKEITSDDGE